MKSLRFLIIGLLSLGAMSILSAQPYSYDFLTQPVSQEDGDKIQTFQITVTTFTTAATLIDAAEPTTSQGLSDRSYRRRIIRNACANGFDVFIGTNTADLATVGGFALGGSSTSVTSVYVTYSRAAIFGQAAAGAGSTGCKVFVLKETNSIP